MIIFMRYYILTVISEEVQLYYRNVEIKKPKWYEWKRIRLSLTKILSTWMKYYKSFNLIYRIQVW